MTSLSREKYRKDMIEFLEDHKCSPFKVENLNKKYQDTGEPLFMGPYTEEALYSLVDNMGIYFKDFIESDQDKSKFFDLCDNFKPMMYYNGVLMKCIHRCTITSTFNLTIPKDAVDEDIVPFYQMYTAHNFSFKGFFKPSVAEVVFQIPDNLLSTCTHFVCEGPCTSVDLNNALYATHHNKHIAITTLYRKNNECYQKSKKSLVQLIQLFLISKHRIM